MEKKILINKLLMKKLLQILLFLFIVYPFIIFGQKRDEIVLMKTGNPLDYEIKILKVTDDSIYYKAFWKTHKFALNEVLSYYIAPKVSKETFITDNKWHTKFGIAFSILTSKHINTYFKASTAFDYSTNYYSIYPQPSFLFVINKNKMILKNELAYTIIDTKLSYQMPIIPSHPWDAADTNQFIIHYHYTVINYKIGIARQLKKFLLSSGFQVGYTFSGYSEIDRVMYSYYSLERIVLFCGVLEANYLFSKNWWIGAGTSLSAPIRGNYIVDKYYIHSLQFTIGHIFNKRKSITK